MKFTVNDKVIIKSLDTLLQEEVLVKSKELQNTYVSPDHTFVLFNDFPFFEKETLIKEVDRDDPDIPYFLTCGIWVPEFMITLKVDVQPDNANLPENENITYTNNFTGKPFGKLFIKLIKLDSKVAEFSNTSFSKLKKHELQYIAELLKNNGLEIKGYNTLNQKDLASLCFKYVKQL